MTNAGWSDGGAYERYMGRWSSRIAREFVGWLSPAPDREWLDVGAGTGALSLALAEIAEARRVTAVEPVAAFRAEAARLRGHPAIAYIDGDASHLPAGPFDGAVSGLVLNFVPDATAALEAMRDATREGGTVASYVWDYAEGMEFVRIFWEVAVSLDAAAEALNQGTRSDICHPDALEAAWRGAGLADVRTGPIEVDVRFANFEDYWQPFTGGQGAAPTYVGGLDEGPKARLREALRERVASGDPEAPITMRARAWAVAGTR
ncbi:MAG: class I SAM-dependent methyltransferase [Dehalococcoidia bacterium]